jgi:hypothetical protein
MVAERTGLLPGLTGAGWPQGMRVLVRRERPHPGAQISVFEAHDGWCYQCLATDTQQGRLAFLEARHRAHARVVDKIRTAKQAGPGRFPSRDFTINAVWLQLALTDADLIAWTQTILLDAALAKAGPKLLRYRLLHTAARIVRRGRRTVIKIAAGWPWANQLAAAFTRLAGIRQPAGLTSQPDPACPRSRTPGEPDTRPAGQPAVTLKINKTWRPCPTMIIPGLTKGEG